MFDITQPSMLDCRYAKVPSCEVARETQQSANIPALSVFSLRLRDTLDFGIDLTDWLAANHNPEINAVVWSVAPESPKTPTLGASAFDKNGVCTVVVSCPATAIPGDTYFLEATMGLDAVIAVQGVPAIPARSLTRRIHIVAAKG